VNKEAIEKTLGSILKSSEDISMVKTDLISF
jgi:hypothetical protein